jgi:hypothetical protein
MTLDEKVAQLGSRWVANDVSDAGGAVGSSEHSEIDHEETFAPLRTASAPGRDVVPSEDTTARHRRSAAR